jgi:hypothetical protein
VGDYGLTAVVFEVWLGPRLIELRVITYIPGSVNPHEWQKPRGGKKDDLFHYGEKLPKYLLWALVALVTGLLNTRGDGTLIPACGRGRDCVCENLIFQRLKL